MRKGIAGSGVIEKLCLRKLPLRQLWSLNQRRHRANLHKHPCWLPALNEQKTHFKNDTTRLIARTKNGACSRFELAWDSVQ